ncbi:MAG TPA: hypothetical protein VKN82_05630 [Desulfohalobiaceae bacterium]|nr:hypothetical protein [Desulfohalobiaceae bacterium]
MMELMLKKNCYDNTKEYALVFRGPETQSKYERIPVSTNWAFMDDI